MVNNNLSLSNMLEVFKERQAKNEAITIMVSIPDTPMPEMITNPPENIPAKIEYFKKTYNEDLTHKFSKGLSIIGYN